MSVRISPVRPSDQRPIRAQLLPMPVSHLADRRPIIVGHRGAKGLAPENTLAAFQVAVDLGIDGVEFDIQRTKNGALVVFHDTDVSRVTDGTGLVPDMTLAEIKVLDAGIKVGQRYQGESVPSLHEAFDFLVRTDLLLFIELKDPWRFPGIEAEVIALIRQYDLVERVQIRSFYHDALYTVFELAPDIAISELWLDRLPADDEVTFMTINAPAGLCNAENIARVHERGQQITAWVVNDVKEARALAAAGIDGITTDFPDQIQLWEVATPD